MLVFGGCFLDFGVPFLSVADPVLPSQSPEGGLELAAWRVMEEAASAAAGEAASGVLKEAMAEAVSVLLVEGA